MFLGCADGGELVGEVVEPGAGFGGTGAADDGGVGGVHRDPGPGLLPHAAGQAVVVGMVVGDHDTVHVPHGQPEGVEPSGQLAPGSRVVPAGVDQDGPAVGVDDVDQGVPERVVRDRHPQVPTDASAVPGHLVHGTSSLRDGVAPARPLLTITGTDCPSEWPASGCLPGCC
ncbi:hypothetical protein BSAF29S_05018 [Bacillus safensis subsp. safensis]